jgi:dinuclear metal center YbgI/SA1388 family protein
VAELQAMVRYMDDALRTSEVPDSEHALNGLQLANGGTVARIAAAVDFSAASVDGAVREGAQLLLVHHGIFWRTQRLVGAAYERLRAAIHGDLAVYSSHIPLDLHPTMGNNALLAAALELGATGSFGRYKGVEIGVMGESDVATRAVVDRCRAYSQRFDTVAVATPFDEKRRTRRWAIITGAGASSDALAEARERGIDTLIVGEGTHHSAVQAMEDGIVVVYAGHYATETLGVRALAEAVGKRFEVPWTFVDVPTGL